MRCVTWFTSWLMSCKFMRWQREASLNISLNIIVFTMIHPSIGDDDLLQLFSQDLTNFSVVSSSERPLISLRILSKSDRDLKIPLIHREEKKIRRERKRSGHQSRIRWSRSERERQQLISRHHITNQIVSSWVTHDPVHDLYFRWCCRNMNKILLLRRSCSSPVLHVDHFIVRQNDFVSCPTRFELFHIVKRVDWIPSL